VFFLLFFFLCHHQQQHKTGGASGPTFGPKTMSTGMAVVAIAGRDPQNGQVTLLHQQVIRSSHANRQQNMLEFADAAAEALLRVVTAQHPATATTITGTDAAAKPCSSQKNHQQDASIIGGGDAVLVLDRATHLRSNGPALAEIELQTSTKYLLLHQNKVYCNGDASGPVHVGLGDMEDLLRGKEYRKSFLGVQSDGSALFSLDILDKEFALTTTTTNPLSSSLWVDTRTGAPLFSATDRAAVLHATALAQWQRKTRYCGQCGGPITFIDAGTCAECVKCQDKSWPRQDPSMIAVILSPDRERVLLARSKRHPPKLYTTLAGFVEAG
jgi:NADH pyrophosphatase NudC (nudix superfamily)